MDKFELMYLEAQIDSVYMEALAKEILSQPKEVRLISFRPPKED